MVLLGFLSLLFRLISENKERESYARYALEKAEGRKWLVLGKVHAGGSERGEGKGNREGENFKGVFRWQILSLLSRRAWDTLEDSGALGWKQHS